jgi:hypothetical protein
MFFPPSLNKQKKYSRKNNEQDEMRQEMPEKKDKNSELDIRTSLL